MKFMIFKLILILLFAGNLFSEKKYVAITIDDIPGTRVVDTAGKSLLLKALDELKVPVAVFINERHIYRKKSVVNNFSILNEWIKRDYVTPANHTFSHPRCSATDTHKFIEDVDRGSVMTGQLSRLYGKKLNYFRFPYNDLGKDEAQHKEVERLLKERGYVIAPFTIESSDWMFNYIYEYYVRKGKRRDAERVASEYIKKTLEYFGYYETLSKKQYDRAVKHIYLCHDNAINAACFIRLCDALRKRGYSFISMDEALKDKVYSQKDHYMKKWGISWFYRWMPDHKARVALMKSEPDMKSAAEEYKRVRNSVKSEESKY